jgi:predicted metal-dependent hydrolase
LNTRGRKVAERLEDVVPPQVFKSEVMVWAKRIGVEPKEIRLRQLKNKWASCSSNGCLTFNSQILSQPARFRAEAIVHELLHLKVPNHGKLFKELMKVYTSKKRDM